MALTRSKAEREATIQDALAKLGAARRERLTPEDFDVYADGLRPFPIEAVVAVCRHLAETQPEEFGPRFPTLGAIRQGISDHLRQEQLRREMNQRNRLLPEGDPLTPEKKAEIMAKFRRVLSERRMP